MSRYNTKSRNSNMTSADLSLLLNEDSSVLKLFYDVILGLTRFHDKIDLTIYLLLTDRTYLIYLIPIKVQISK